MFGTESGTIKSEIVETISQGQNLVVVNDLKTNRPGPSVMMGPNDYSALLATPYRCATYDWTTASGVGAFAPWSFLTSNSDWSEKLKHATAFSGNCRVRVQVSGSPFHYGRLIVGYTPVSAARMGRSNAAYTNSTVGIACLPHVLVDPSNQDPVEFTIPFRYPYPMLNLNGGDESAALTNMGSVYYMPLVALAASNATATSVTVSFHVYFTDVVVSGLTPLTTLTTMGKMEGKPGILPSKVGTAVAGALTVLSTIPVLAPFTLPAAAFAGAASAVAASLGYSRPPVTDQTPAVLRTVTGTMSSMIGNDYSYRLIGDPKQSLSIAGATYGFSDYDEMSFDFIKRQWGIVAAYTWFSTSATGIFIGSLGVTPTMLGPAVTGTSRLVPPTCGLGLLHAAWSGGMEYRIIVVASPMMRGALSIRHIPYAVSAAAPVGFGNVSTSSCILDIVAGTVIDITVPWAQNSMVATSVPATAGMLLSATGFANFPGASGYIESVNGFLVFEVLNKLNGNLAGLSAQILVYQRGAPDLTFINPDGGTFSQGVVLTSGSFDDYERINIDSPWVVKTSGGMTVASDVEVPMCTLGIPVVTSLPNLFTTGEKLDSIRTLLHRFVVIGAFSLTTTVSTAFYHLYLPQVPTDTAPGGAITPLAFLSKAFTGMKGGYRYKGVLTQGGGTSNELTPRIFNGIATPMYYAIGPTSNMVGLAPTNFSTGGAGTIFPAYGGIYSTAAATQIVTGKDMIEIDVPDPTYALWSLAAVPRTRAAPTSMYGLGNAYTVTMGAYCQASSGQVSGAGLQYPPYMVVYGATSDDFSLLGFHGFPAIDFAI